MVELLRAYPAIAPIIGDLIAKNLDWPGADEIAERLKSMLPPPAKGGLPPEVQKIMEEGKAMIAKLQQENDVLKNDSSAKAEELKIKFFEAVTKRMGVENDKMVAQTAAQPMPGLPPEVQQAFGQLQQQAQRTRGRERAAQVRGIL